MARDITRRSVCCPCGGDWYERTWDFSTAAHTPIWVCRNCHTQTPRYTVARRTNHRKAIDAYLALRAEWHDTDQALSDLVDARTVPGGCILVYASTFNYHLKQLTDKTAPSNFDVRYHATQARADLQKARAFVAAHRPIHA